MNKIEIKFYRIEREGEIKAALRRGMGKAVLIVENQAKKNVSQTGEKHPQVKTGRLRASIESDVSESGNKIVGTVGTNVEYGKPLEFGTSRHPPYPWLYPAVESKRGEIKAALEGKFD